jgi:hypothetical protein
VLPFRSVLDIILSLMLLCVITTVRVFVVNTLILFLFAGRSCEIGDAAVPLSVRNDSVLGSLFANEHGLSEPGEFGCYHLLHEDAVCDLVQCRLAK